MIIFPDEFTKEQKQIVLSLAKKYNNINIDPTHEFEDFIQEAMLDYYWKNKKDNIPNTLFYRIVMFSLIHFLRHKAFNVQWYGKQFIKIPINEIQENLYCYENSLVFINAEIDLMDNEFYKLHKIKPFKLRKKGWNFLEIADHYDIPESTFHYWYKQFIKKINYKEATK